MTHTSTSLLLLPIPVVYSTRLTTEYVQEIIGWWMKHAAAEILVNKTFDTFANHISTIMLVESKLFNCNNEV